MEKCFLVSEQSKYYKDSKKYRDMEKKQIEFVDNFFNEKGICANEFKVEGNGRCNIPFDENNKNNISLYIIPIDTDLKKLEKNICRANQNGLCKFRKNSKILKEFSQRCIDEKIVINLLKPLLMDYFKSIGFRYNCQQFLLNDNLYIKIHSKTLKDDDIPEGFEEIKISDFYLKLEEYKKLNKK